MGRSPVLTSGTLRNVVTPAVVLRLALGWGACITLVFTRSLLSAHLPTPMLLLVLTALISVIVVCAFGVVAEAEQLAKLLGDPYGTLVLTLSIVLIEVILISAVMLSPGEHPTIARDSVMAVTMIIMNLVVGVALLVGGVRHHDMRPNRTGVSIYLSLLVVLLAVAFAFPALIGADGAYTTAQEVPIIALTVLLYALFLVRQMGAQRTDFQEVGNSAQPQQRSETLTPELRTSRRSKMLLRTLVLIVTVVPIVLLSHDMAALLDEGLHRAGAPVALSGIIIAVIVFLPETLTAIRAAYAGEIQRVSNLCHGALVSTVGLTVPAVLTIALVTGQHVVLAESPTNLLLIAVTLLLTLATFGGRRVTALHGAAHVLVFALYCLTVFASVTLE